VQEPSLNPGPQLVDRIQILCAGVTEQPRAAGLVGCPEHQPRAEQINPALDTDIVHTRRGDQDGYSDRGTVAGKQIEDRSGFNEIGQSSWMTKGWSGRQP
jgi:hypothetical protein